MGFCCCVDEVKASKYQVANLFEIFCIVHHLVVPFIVAPARSEYISCLILCTNMKFTVIPLILLIIVFIDLFIIPLLLHIIAIIITLNKHELPRPGSNKRPPNDPTPGNVDRRAFQTQGTLLSWDFEKR